MAASTFWWRQGEYTTTAATLLILSTYFWLAAFKALFSLTAPALPRYSVYGLWIAYAGCLSGCCFAFLGYMADVLQVTHQQYLAALTRHPVSSQLLLFATGPLFPLSILIYGLVAIRVRTLPAVIGLLLCAGAVAFPLSRITRIPWIAHLADALVLIPCLTIALLPLSSRTRHRPC